MSRPDIDALSDDEAIAMVALLGYDKYHASPSARSAMIYAFWRTHEGVTSWGEVAGGTKGEAARNFLRRHLPNPTK